MDTSKHESLVQVEALKNKNSKEFSCFDSLMKRHVRQISTFPINLP